MKLKSILPLLFISISFLRAQSESEALLNALPPAPVTACSDNEAAQKKFSDKVYEIIERLKEAKEKINESMEGEMAAGRVQPIPGVKLSPGQMKKMEDMSDAEAEAMAQKMMAEMIKNGGGVKMMSQEEFMKKKKASDLNQDLIDPMRDSYASTLDKMIKEYQSIIDEADKYLDKNIPPLEEELLSLPDGEGLTPAIAAKARSIRSKIKTVKDKCCAEYSPKYNAVLDKHLTFLKRELMAKLREAEKNKMEEMGLTKQQDHMLIDAIITYAGKLGDAYHFNITSDSDKAGKFE